MNTIEHMKQLALLIEALLPVLRQIAVVFNTLARHPLFRSQVSYENLSLDLTVDLTNPRGTYAVVTRQQRVRFAAREAGVITSPVWGEGSQMTRYRVSGAKRLGTRREGPRDVLLLGLESGSHVGRVASLSARRTVRNGFTHSREYFETIVERPTESMSLRVLFPRTRGPKQALLVATPGMKPETVPIAIRTDGRAELQWRQARPRQGVVYSLRWLW